MFNELDRIALNPEIEDSERKKQLLVFILSHMHSFNHCDESFNYSICCHRIKSRCLLRLLWDLDNWVMTRRLLSFKYLDMNLQIHYTLDLSRSSQPISIRENSRRPRVDELFYRTVNILLFSMKTSHTLYFYWKWILDEDRTKKTRFLAVIITIAAAPCSVLNAINGSLVDYVMMKLFLTTTWTAIMWNTLLAWSARLSRHENAMIEAHLLVLFQSMCFLSCCLQWILLWYLSLVERQRRTFLCILHSFAV